MINASINFDENIPPGVTGATLKNNFGWGNVKCPRLSNLSRNRRPEKVHCPKCHVYVRLDVRKPK
jgi:hypothetical protein